MADETVLSFGYDGKDAEDGIRRLAAGKNELLKHSSGDDGLFKSLAEAEKQVGLLDSAITGYGKTHEKAFAAQEATGSSLDRLAAKYASTAGVVMIIKANAEALADETKELADKLGVASPAVDKFKVVLERLGDPAGALKNTFDLIGVALDLAREKLGLFMSDAERARGLTITKDISALLEKIKSAGPDLQKGIHDLAIAVEEIERTGKATAAQSAIIDQETKKLLDRAEELGVKVPRGLARIATAYGVVSTSAEKAATEQEQAAERAAKAAQREAEEQEKAAQRIKDAFQQKVDVVVTGVRGSSDSIEERLKVLRAAADEIAKQRRISIEEQTKLGDVTAELVEDYKNWTDTPLPTWLERLNKLLPTTASETDKNAKATKALNEALKETADLAQRQAADAERQLGTTAARIAELEGKDILSPDEQTELNDLKDQEITLSGDAARAKDAEAKANATLANAQQQTTRSTEDQLKAYFEAVDASIAAAQGLDTLVSKTLPMSGAALKAALGLKDLSAQAAGTRVQVRELADGTKVVEVAQDDLSRALRQTKDQAKESGDQLGELGDEAKKLGDEAEAAGDKLKSPTDQIEDLGEIAKGTKEELVEVRDLLAEALVLYKQINVEAQALKSCVQSTHL